MMRLHSSLVRKFGISRIKTYYVRRKKKENEQTEGADKPKIGGSNDMVRM